MTNLISFDGFNDSEIRVTDDGRYSVYDVIRFCGQKKPHQVWSGDDRGNGLRVRYSEVSSKCENFKFAGKGQRETPVADKETCLEILRLLKSHPDQVAVTSDKFYPRTETQIVAVLSEAFQDLSPMILNDRQITELSNEAADPLICPMIPALIRRVDSKGKAVIFGGNEDDRKVISYGRSSYGYDLRLGEEFKIFRHIPGTVINPKNFNPENVTEAPLYSDKWGKYFILPAHSYGLGVSMERLSIPKNVTALFIGKSTYARSGIIVNLTPGESGWIGHLTIEISNASSADCRIYAGEGICQALFFEGEPCETAYGNDRKYQNQPAQVVLAKV